MYQEEEDKDLCERWEVGCLRTLIYSYNTEVFLNSICQYKNTVAPVRDCSVVIKSHSLRGVATWLKYN